MTETQKRILAILADGGRHSIDELHGCLWDELSAKRTVYTHLSFLRKKLPEGQAIISEWWRGKCWYRHIILLSFLGTSSPSSDSALTPVV